MADESTLGQDFIDWLRRRFKWMFESQQASTSIGTAYLYADEPALPSWAALGSYDNGSASGTGRTEYIWLPLPDGGAIPIGMYRNGQSYAIHTDHLGTPRQMTDASGTPVWQWPYSAFGQNRPIGVLVPTTDPLQATTIEPTMLRATTPTVTLDLRFPGQMADVETGTFYNYYRNYVASQGRYSQVDPIGLAGGWNGFLYVAGNPLSYTDPRGLAIGDMPPPPPGYSPDWPVGQWPNGKPYLRDPDGGTWTAHPEDKGHWRHWDKQDSDGNDDGMWPPNSKKPWPGQKKPKKDQCEADPNGDAPPWDPTKYDLIVDDPRLWMPSWLGPRPSMPRMTPRFFPRFVFP